MHAARSSALAAVLPLAAGLGAQSFNELQTVRDRPTSWESLLQVKAGVIGSLASEEDPVAGLADEFGWDGHVYYRQGRHGGGTAIDAYAGRDGAIVSFREGQLLGNDTMSRIELSTRYFAFQREGFYRGDSFVPTGRYEVDDYELYAGAARIGDQSLLVEVGAFYRMNEFDRSDDTASNYTIPDDFNAYGARLFFEQTTAKPHPVTGLLNNGWVFTIVAENEWNDSDALFGVTGSWMSRMPSSVWRGRGRMEWYMPSSDDAAWEVFIEGAVADKGDRVKNYDATNPLQGHIWADAQLRYRFSFSDSFSVSPFVAAQFTKIAQESGYGSDQKFFFGGGVEAWLHFSKAVSLNAWYSYINNESRPPVSTDEDLYGEHMFFIGAVIRLGV